MVWLVFLLIIFSVAHFAMFLPAQLSIVLAAVAIVALWVLWKLKWVILGIIGLEEIFGGRGDGT